MEDFTLLDLNREMCFITGSTYQGDWKLATQSMEGFGIYKFPNNCIYRGYFRAGKFHGSGRMKAPSPYNFVLYGDFEDGHLIKLEYMVFHDGLRIYGDCKNGAIDFSEWKYCRSDDRRFAKEHAKGLKAFGVTPETAVEKSSYLKHELYDTEEGTYNEKIGFISERMLPFRPTEFVGCFKDARWIKRHCRAGRCNGEIVEPSEKVCHSILANNIENQKWADANFGEKCTAGQKERYKYFSEFYEKDLNEAKRIIDGEENFEAKSFIDEDLKSESSFSVGSPRNTALFERICERPKSPCQCEGSLSVDIAAFSMTKSLYG